TSSSSGVVSKVQVKKEIKTIVENLETILGDLKDVAKELKEVVHEIDTLTCDLQLEEEGLTDSSKTDTLNSSSSSTTTTTTASSLEKMKLLPEEYFFKTQVPFNPVPVNPSAVLTVLKKPHPPLPPPRLTSQRAEDHSVKSLPHPTLVLSGNISKAPGREPRERERVRFSEKVQYHGYCPDCDLQYDVDETELHLQAELSDLRLSPVHSFPPTTNTLPPCVPPHAPSLKPHKTILRKSTTTTV
uniref:Proline rich 16 n=1 Tax=Oryzias melastigma TaxID=30732 RepID=A0A3B3CKR7_ORYME